MNKISFDILEVGCKYESRCGEIWEVTYFDENLEEGDGSPFLAADEDGWESWFTDKGLFFEDHEDKNDLVFKLVENTWNRYKVKHSIDVGAPLAAAKWICENNPYMKAQGKSVDDMLKSIHDSVRWLLEDVERVGTGTAGYMVRRCWEGEYDCVIEITVDPCVGSHTYYADVEDYLNQSGV